MCKAKNERRSAESKRGKAQKLPPMRLTDVLIDKLQNYFGIALRRNATTVLQLQKALLASFFTQHHLVKTICTSIAPRLLILGANTTGTIKLTCIRLDRELHRCNM